MKVRIEPIKPLIGGIVHVDKADLCDPEVGEAVRTALEERGVLVFPQMNLTDDEQLAFTDSLGARVNFTRRVPGSDASAQDVYKVTLNKAFNQEPDYVYGTFFWHIDGITMDMPLPKATLLTARHLSSEGGATEFANLYAAYDRLSDAEKAEIDGLNVYHTLESSTRPVYGRPPEERLARWAAMTPGMIQPLAWRHDDGRTSLVVGTHAEAIEGMPGPHGRAMIARLIQWAAQPDFVYRHDWKVGDLVIWDNLGLMHRVVPYTDQNRSMHRTSIGSQEKPGRPLDPALLEGLVGELA